MDIIFLAAIVAFFFFKLRSVLGKRTGNERQWHFDPSQKKKGSQANDQQADKAAPNMADTMASSDPDGGDVPTYIAQNHINEEAWKKISTPQAFEGLKKLHAMDSGFDAVQFLEGAKAAFERILDNFAAGMKGPLKGLLSKDVYNAFGEVIDRRQDMGHRLNATIVALDEAKIVDVELEGSQAYVSVEFASRQISVTKDQEGHIIEGDPKQISVVNDLWTFSRDMKSRDPNWILVGTGG